MVFKTSSYETSFAGMLKWEETLQQDLTPFLHASTTPGTTTFQDVVIRNKDVRVLKDTTGKAAILYSFPSKDTLVITTDEETFKEIIGRLAPTQFVQ